MGNAGTPLSMSMLAVIINKWGIILPHLLGLAFVLF
jgi:hypothetical protein